MKDKTMAKKNVIAQVAPVVAAPALDVIRADMLEVGKIYSVDVHGIGAKRMRLISKPDVSISKMTAEDSFVFSTVTRNPKEMVFRSHMNAGPKFLVTEVESQRGTRKARVTFRTKAKVETPVTEKVAKAA